MITVRNKNITKLKWVMTTGFGVSLQGRSLEPQHSFKTKQIHIVNLDKDYFDWRGQDRSHLYEFKREQEESK